MSIKKPFEGLRIEILEGDRVLIGGQIRKREYFREYADELFSGVHGTMLALASREILRMMDEFEEPVHDEAFEHEEDCPCYGDTARHSKDCANCTCEKTACEPGTVLVNDLNHTYRLDRYIRTEGGIQWWSYTDMSNGEQSEGDFSESLYKVHRLPHEFKVGDWAQWIGHTPGPFQITNIQSVDGREMIYGIGAFLSAEECGHVPPPKNSPSGNKTSEKPDPLQGPHWDALEEWLAIRNESISPVIAEVQQAYQRDRDLRDELRRVREGLK